MTTINELIDYLNQCKQDFGGGIRVVLTAEDVDIGGEFIALDQVPGISESWDGAIPGQNEVECPALAASGDHDWEEVASQHEGTSYGPAVIDHVCAYCGTLASDARDDDA